jgi:hypothetical protein
MGIGTHCNEFGRAPHRFLREAIKRLQLRLDSVNLRYNTIQALVKRNGTLGSPLELSSRVTLTGDD